MEDEDWNYTALNELREEVQLISGVVGKLLIGKRVKVGTTYKKDKVIPSEEVTIKTVDFYGNISCEAESGPRQISLTDIDEILNDRK